MIYIKGKRKDEKEKKKNIEEKDRNLRRDSNEVAVNRRLWNKKIKRGR